MTPEFVPAPHYPTFVTNQTHSQNAGALPPAKVVGRLEDGRHAQVSRQPAARDAVAELGMEAHQLVV
jgi:hypothetical protein